MDSDQHKKTQISLVYFLAAMVILFAFQWIFLAGSTREVAYSDFKAYLNKGLIKAVVISPTTIKGTMSDPTGKSDKPVLFSVTRVTDPNLIKDLDSKGVKYAGRTNNSIWQTIFAWIIPIILMIAVWNYMIYKMGMGGPGIMKIGQNKSKLVASDDATKITFKDVAGIDEAKEELEEVIEFLKEPAKFESLGGKIPRGILLLGAPGTGKTLLSKAVAGEAHVPFFSISGSEFVEMFVGVGAARVRDLFTQATAKAPCIIFIDELDALGKARGFNPLGGNDEREQTLNQLLVEMDGFDTQKGVIIMAATNRPEILDPALLRPGRFDRQVVVDKPDLAGREAILKIHSKDVKLADDIDFHAIAARTPGFVGADLANIVNEAALLAVRRKKKSVTMAEFAEAIERVIAGLEKKKRLINPKEKKIVAYHESGHAIVADALPNTDVVEKISIVPRGIAALGYTLQLPTEDRFLMTKHELEDKLAVLLGGRVAEEIFFGDISTGAQNDLQRATDIARAMVKEYGMSEKLGLLTYERPHNVFLKGDNWRPTEKEYSDEVAAIIDSETKRIMDEAHSRTYKIIEEKKKTVEKLAKVLLEKEVVEKKEFQKIVTES
ncbi:MAG: ATP-dependent metallopeptidase FtsH/Yme1/Tma family protein [Spirochaetes bacterium]|nr:ATP-dependent metallopeptidase FtsH/Yme1/Tma family protein [Spirochaetota bacterium]